MSCIKFPSSKSELSRTANKENVNDFSIINSELITIANQIFGQGNWSHSINTQTLDFVEYVTGKYQAGCVSIVRVQLKDGTFHEDIGYSNNEGSTKGSAIQKARLGSFNNALKNALICFGCEIANKIKRISNRSKSPATIENIPNKLLQIEASSSSNPVNDKPEEVTETIETIPLSQADVFMDVIDFTELNKDLKTNTKTLSKEEKVKVATPKHVKPTTSSIVTEKDKKTDIMNTKNEVPKDSPKISTVSNNASINKDIKLNPPKESKTEVKPELLKLVISTAMTEEEMRLERKRKQREMQEQFKKKEEYKKKYADSGVKQTPNPRY